MSTPRAGVETAQERPDSSWEAGALVTNPGTSGILKQSGVLAKGVYHLAMVGWASVEARYRIAIRNAADSADVKSVDVPMPANNSIPFTAPTIVNVEVNETFRVINVTSFTGTGQASIFYAKVGGGA